MGMRILCALGVLLLVSLPTQAQQPEKIRRIGLLIAASDVIAPFTHAFRQGLRELGYVEGKNYRVEIRGGGADADRLFDLAAELVRFRVDVIVSVGSPALRAAAKATVRLQL